MGQSHYVVTVKAPIPSQRTREQSHELGRRNSQFKAQAHLPQSAAYFVYKDGDAKGEARAKKQADIFAKKWSAKLGFELQVNSGFFL